MIYPTNIIYNKNVYVIRPFVTTDRTCLLQCVIIPLENCIITVRLIQFLINSSWPRDAMVSLYLAIVCYANDFFPTWHQAIASTNADQSIGPNGSKFSVIQIKMQ